MHERSAQSGDGQWRAVPELSTHQGTPLLVETTLRPHKFKRFSFVHLVAIDRSRVDLRLVAGTREPVSKAVPEDQRPGLVPGSEHSRLLAVFNGGFKAKHGGYGMRVGERAYLPPRPDVCTVATLKDGSLRIATWQNLAPEEDQIEWFRQGPSCLVEDGKVNPQVNHSVKRRKYGLAADGKFEIRRSALAIDASGRTLYYAVGEEMTPRLLVDALMAVGVQSAAQLDVNWSYTRFVVFGSRKDEPSKLEVTRTLLPKMKHSRRGYVERASSKDFFYLLAPEGWAR